jgi:hypothetical protein
VELEVDGGDYVVYFALGSLGLLAEVLDVLNGVGRKLPM